MSSPNFIGARYTHDPVTSWFAMDAPCVSGPLPTRVKAAETRRSDIRGNGAGWILHGPCESGRHAFLTGLRPTNFPGWREGNLCEHRGSRAVRSLVVCRFTGGTNYSPAGIALYLFKGHYPRSRAARAKFIREFVQCLELDRARNDNEGE